MTEVRPHKEGGLAAVGDAHALLHDAVGGKCRDFLEEPLVVDVRHVHPESAFLGQLHDAEVRMPEIGRDFFFDLALGAGVERGHVHAWEIHPAFVFKVVLQIAQEVHLLEGGPQV